MQSPIDNLIFEDEERIKDLIDPEEIINIDFDGLEESSKKEAEDMIQALSVLYCDEEFMKRQPRLKKRIDTDLESLRINLKMRKADEQAHDILLKNIGCNPNNASLYRALTDLQKTILNITTKIEDTVSGLTNLLKGYQQEINFDQPQESEEEPQESRSSFRGSKEFIQAMNDEEEEETE